MNSEDRGGDEGAGGRLFDVLLREQCRDDDHERIAADLLRATPVERDAARCRAEAAEPAPSANAARWWMVVAALLAVGVVVATMRLQPQPVTIVLQTPQEPQGGRETKPRSYAHFVELLGTAKAIRIGRSEPIGATRHLSDSGVSDVLDVVRWPEIVRVEGEALGAWREQFAASAGGEGKTNAFADLVSAAIELADGTEMVVTFTVDPTSCFLMGVVESSVQVTEGLRSRVLAARDELARLHRRAAGKANDEAELAALPADSKRLECPWFADGKMGEHLARFPSLETFVLAKGPGAGLDAAGLRELVAKKTLTSLDLRAAELASGDLAPLAELPTLTSLALRGAPALGQPIAQFAPNLAELTLERCRMSGAVGFFLRGCKRLKVLRLIDCDFAASSASCVEIASLPSLAQLVVRQQERPAPLFDALKLSKLQSLRFVDMPVTGSDLALLAELPTLRELAVLAPTIDDGEAGSLAALKQLTSLRLMNVAVSKDGLADLQKALPKCAIDCVPGRRVFDTAAWLVR